MKARVYVTLKRAVLDPQGKTVARSLAEMGYSEVEEVRVGKLIEIELASKSAKEAERRVQEMSEKLLANPIIEEFRIELSPEEKEEKGERPKR